MTGDVTPIALSHGGPAIYDPASRSGPLLVGTIDGVVCIERPSSSRNWRIAFHALAGTHIQAIAVEPLSGMVFAGAKQGSLFASRDGGRSWERSDRGLEHHDVYCLEVAAAAGGPRLYAGTEPAHLYCSDDLGANWKALAGLRALDTSRWTFPDPPHVAHTKHIAVHPRDADTLYVCIEQGALLKTTDAGRSFSVIAGMDEDLHRTVISPLDPDTVFIVTGIGIYVTRDAGKSVIRLTDEDHEVGGYPDLLVLHPRRPELLFVAAARENPDFWSAGQNASARIARSEDGGTTWNVPNAFRHPVRPAFEAMCLAGAGQGFSVFAATAAGEIWASDDGEHWGEVVTGLPPVSKGTHYRCFLPA